MIFYGELPETPSIRSSQKWLQSEVVETCVVGAVGNLRNLRAVYCCPNAAIGLSHHTLAFLISCHLQGFL
jgi:hypothetical protein